MKQNESIKLVRNPDYWKSGRPYLDGIEFAIISNRATSLLTFVAGKLDLTFTSVITPTMVNDLETQASWVICEAQPTNTQSNLLVNRDKPPFDDARIRKAMVLPVDRAALNEILGPGRYRLGGAMLPPPEGQWGMPKEFLSTVAGYGSAPAKAREEGRKIMSNLGYSAEKPLKIKVSTRNIPSYRDPAVILIDHLKQVYIQGVGVDDPDVALYETFSCSSERNCTNYCNPEVEKLFDQQSRMTDLEARKKLVWEIDKKLQEDGARPVIQHGWGGTCWRPEVKGVNLAVNTIYNH